MAGRDQLQVVLVHDWLTGMRGGEKVLEVLCRHWPQAQLFTLLHRRGTVSEAIEGLKPAASFFRYFPQVHRYYRYLLPLMPLAARWRLPACDLVVSSSHCVAKAALPPPGVPHVCYCHTPMRYAWHMQTAYFGGDGSGGWKAWLRERILKSLRHWDRRTADRVSHFIANSRAVQQRIRECYGRESVVIHPPVDTDYYTPAPMPREDYYLVVSAFAPYKRLDLAISACNQLGRKLVIIGTGQEEKRLRTLAEPNVHFLGWQPDRVIRDHLRRCRALLFPGEEDFGIVPVEAQACGAPVVAFSKGGATETVVPLPREGRPPSEASEPTGLWFEEQTAECLVRAMLQLEAQRHEFNPAAARRRSLQFNQRRFAREIFGYLSQVVDSTPIPSRWAA